MRTKKPKANEPSARDKLSAAFVKALEADFSMYGVESIEKLRETHPDKYVELTARLIAAREPKSDGFETAQTYEEIGRKLLQSIGFSEPDDASIAEAVEINNTFVDGLQAIYQRAQNGGMQ